MVSGGSEAHFSTALEAELELQNFVCKTREEAKNFAGAGMGEQDFDLAQVGWVNFFFNTVGSIHTMGQSLG